MSDAPISYAPRETAGKATAALVVAIVGFFVCAPLGGIIAVILAGSATREIRESNGRLGGEGLVTAARIIGWIGIAIGLLAVLAIFAIAFLGNTSKQKLDQIEREMEPRVVVDVNIEV